MSGRNTIVRSMHDIGLAAWFGGGLMGVVGLNGGTAKANDPTERLRLAGIGWARWAPVQLAAIAVHGAGGIGLILGNKGRLTAQGEARTNTLIKTGVTVAAGAASIAAGIAGAQILRRSDEGGEGVTEPRPGASRGLAAAQVTEKALQWSIPVLTGVLLVLAAQQGEQQRAGAGWVGTIGKRAKQLIGR